jgi:hypothetical protein
MEAPLLENKNQDIKEIENENQNQNQNQNQIRYQNKNQDNDLIKNEINNNAVKNNNNNNINIINKTLNTITEFKNSYEISNEKNNKNNNNNNNLSPLDLVKILENTMIKSENFSRFQREKLFISFMLFFLVIYFFNCLTLFILNCQPMEIISEKYEIPFHMLDFWGSFIFTLIEGCILVNANIVTIESIRFPFIAFNIGMTLLAAVLYSVNPEYWEVPAHWIEYFAQICIVLSDLSFIFHQFKNTENILYKYRYFESVLICFLVIFNFLKLLLYGEVISWGFPGEQSAHFIEFLGEMINAAFAFLFTIVYYKDCDQNLKHLFINKSFLLDNVAVSENERINSNTNNDANKKFMDLERNTSIE